MNVKLRIQIGVKINPAKARQVEEVIQDCLSTKLLDDVNRCILEIHQSIGKYSVYELECFIYQITVEVPHIVHSQYYKSFFNDLTKIKSTIKSKEA